MVAFEHFSNTGAQYDWQAARNFIRKNPISFLTPYFSCFFLPEICDQLQKDDEEWCYFMRYGKPRRNRAIPDLSKPIVPEDNATLERRKRRQKWWQWLNATLSFVCLAVFITILLILFMIFFNVDSSQSTLSDVFHSNHHNITTSFNTSTVIPPTW